MISKVGMYSNKNYNSSFTAKVPDKKLIISCFDGKEVVVGKDEFTQLLTKHKKYKPSFCESVKGIFLECFPFFDATYRKIMKSVKKYNFYQG